MGSILFILYKNSLTTLLKSGRLLSGKNKAWLGLNSVKELSFSDHTHSTYAVSNHNHDTVYAKLSHTHISNDITDVIPISKGGTGVTTLDELKAIMKSAADYSDMHETVSGTISLYMSGYMSGSSRYWDTVEGSVPTPSFPWKSFTVQSVTGGWTITSSSSTSTTLELGSVSTIRVTISLDTSSNTLSLYGYGEVNDNFVSSQHSTFTLYANG